MGEKNMIRFILFFLIILIMAPGCKREDELPECGCEGKTYYTYSGATGIVLNDSTGNFRIIVSDADYTLALVPCNPEIVDAALMTDGLHVIFSGNRKGICPEWRVAGVPTQFSKIEMASPIQ